ncbi:hypothetical protein BDZ94DRAFT_1275301 [Collybia nuda]|uniref:Uncharacterized protein n=1 Tax=Collybia nuda TaxID=64659 RepID=A0A9P6CD19_9AGAR|nr:hypothetical protein BDZ94DRAFT_1275301 [Collybia nuda]
MTPDETRLLLSAGEAFNHNTIQIICQTAFYGMYLLIFPYAVLVLWRRCHWTAITLTMLLLTCFMFAVASIYWAAMISQSLILIQMAFIKNMDEPLAIRVQLANAATVSSLRVQNWPQYLNFICGDGIVVWRVWALWPENRVPRWSVLILLVASTVTSLCAAILPTIDEDPKALLSIIQANFQLASFVLSLATNAVATVLIGYKAWFHRQLIKECYGKLHQHSKALKTLLLLVESGVIYCAIQLVYVVLDAQSSNPNSAVGFAERVINGSAIIIAAMYPTLIIILVALQQSIADTPGISTIGISHDSMSLQPTSALRFALSTQPAMTHAYDSRQEGIHHGLGDIVDLNMTQLEKASQEKM